MVNGWHTQKPVSSEGLPLKGKKILEQYYQGQRMESPEGGTLHLLRIRPEPDGSGTVLMECSVSSLRYELHIPKATRSEKTAVKNQQSEGMDPTCPRHTDPREKLLRSGEMLVCPKCGVRYTEKLLRSGETLVCPRCGVRYGKSG
ncbi:MAG: hypothetical protein P8188_07640 [Gemmatimonadota bacterium]